MADGRSFSRLEAARREQVPQAFARLAVIVLFIALWFVLWLVRIPMPLPFLAVLALETLFFLVYLRLVFVLPTVRAVELGQYGMLAAEICFHTTIVYFLGGISWLGSFAYVFGLIFANTFLDLRRGFAYTAGASLAFTMLIVLEATGAIPHYVYLEQGPLRYTDARFVATTAVGGMGVFFSIYLWVNWVGRLLRQERDTAVRAQDGLLAARAELVRANEELEERVRLRTAELEVANAALRESEQRLHLVLETCPDLISIQGLDARYHFVNSAFRIVLGYAVDELLGQSPTDLVHPDDLEEVREKYRAIASSGAPSEATFRFRHADGHWVVLEGNGQALLDPDGQPGAVVVVARDVTARKRAEDAVRESEERFRKIFEEGPLGMAMVSPDFRIMRANATLCRMLGYAEDELRALTFADVTHPDDLDADVLLARRVFAGEIPSYRIEKRYIRKDGNILWGGLSASVIRDQDGAPLYGLGMVEDITERKRAEEALRESESKFRAMAETVAAAAFIFQGSRMRYVNSAAQATTGYSRDELLSMDFWEVIHPDFRDLVKERGLARQRGEDVEQRYEVKLQTKEGEERWVDFTAAMIEFEGAPAVLGTAFDITERKRSERLLAEQRRVLEMIATSASLEEVLEALVHTIEEGRRGLLCSVCVVRSDGTALRPVAAPSLPKGFTEALSAGVPIGPAAGACGTAAYRRQPVISQDIATDPLWEEYRELALQHGLRACWSTPIFSATGYVLGTFAIYHREPHAPAQEEFQLVAMVSHIAGIAIERRRAEEALRERANRDPLTGLLNRRAGLAAIEERFEQAKSEGKRFAMLVLDLDKFKSINDSFSHERGDGALLHFAQVVVNLVGDRGTVCRLGGDEFEIALDDAGLDEAIALAGQIRTTLQSSLERLHEEEGAPLFAVSIGVACYPEDGRSTDELGRRADQAMYSAKAFGGDGCRAWRQVARGRAA